MYVLTYLLNTANEHSQYPLIVLRVEVEFVAIAMACYGVYTMVHCRRSMCFLLRVETVKVMVDYFIEVKLDG